MMVLSAIEELLLRCCCCFSVFAAMFRTWVYDVGHAVMVLGEH